MMNRTATKSFLVDLKKTWSSFKEEGFRFPCYMLSQPFKAFGDIKYEGRGSVKTGIVILILLCVVAILNKSYLGFIVNLNNPYYVSTFGIIMGQVAQVLLFAVANWSITVLIDGSGSFKEIFMVNMYAYYPTVYLNFIYVILTNVLTNEELPLATVFLIFSTVTYIFYMFIGMIVIHEFTFFKAITSLILTVIAMMIILFVVLLIATMANELISFFQTIYREIILHYA